MASNQFTYSQVKDVNEENNDDGANVQCSYNNEDMNTEASVESWMRSMTSIFVVETIYECLAVNDVDYTWSKERRAAA